MKQLIYFIIVFTLSSQSVISQSTDYTFGRLSQKEVDLEIYEEDPDAEAVVLFDIGNTYFFDSDGGYDIRFTRTKRLKILSNAGIKYADVSIPLYVDGYGKTERVVSIEAYTYNIQDGRLLKTPVAKQSIFEEIMNDRWKVKKFTFPNVQVGSIIEYKLVFETPFLFNTPNWQFQDFIPTIYSEYMISIIPFYEYVFYAQGISKFDIRESHISNVDRTFGNVSDIKGRNHGSGVVFNDVIYRFALNNVPAFKDEGYITSVEDYLIKLKFQLATLHRPNGTTEEIMSTWSDLKESLLKNQYFGKYLKSGEKQAEKVIAQLAINQLSETDRAKTLIDYVKENFSWSKFNSKYSSKSVKQFLTEKEGNSADINLYLISLLRTAGIKAEPVILSTRNHGKIKSDYPFISFFNYVVALVEVDGHTFLADGTTDLLAFNRIPPRCINEQGLIIDKKENVQFIDLKNQFISINRTSLSLKFSEDMNYLKVKSKVFLSEFEAYNFRNKFQNDTSKLAAYFLSKGLSEIDQLSTSSFSNKDKPYSINLSGTSSFEKVDNLLIIKPFLGFPLDKHNLTQKKRTYPVDLIYVQSKNYNSTINIPEGYKIDDLPENTNMDNSLAKISTMYTVQDNNLSISAVFYLKKSTYSSAEYSRIKFYFNQVVKDFNREIILIRST